MIGKIKCLFGFHSNRIDRDKGVGVAKTGFLVSFICSRCQTKSIIVVRK